MQTLSELLRSHARHFRHKTFLVCGDKTWTYGEYFAQVEKLAQVLVDHGVSTGQPVCLYAKPARTCRCLPRLPTDRCDRDADELDVSVC
jgi:acyl-CoA synthetase (AMP-forming)/AMP-acid ligase II